MFDTPWNYKPFAFLNIYETISKINAHLTR